MGLIDRIVTRLVGPPPAAVPDPITEATFAAAHDASGPVDDPRNMDVIDPANGFGGSNSMFNAMSGAGTLRDASVFARWVAQRRLSKRELFALGRNSLTARGLGLVGNTATREGWRVVPDDPRVADPQALATKITQYEQRLGIPGKAARALFRSRQYSQSLVLLNVVDGRAWNEPVDVNNIQTVRWATVIDRRDFYITKLAGIDEPEFSQPEVFRITDINGVLEDGLRYGDDLGTLYSILDATLQQTKGHTGYMDVHADRVLSFATTDYYPLLEGMQDSLSAYFETTRGMQQWAREASMKIYKVTDLFKKIFGVDASKTYARIALVEKLKSSLNAWVIDSTAEDVTSAPGGGAGVDKLADPFMVWVATGFGIPITQFWGVSPGGFGTGDSERATWHEEVRALQDQVLASERCLPKLHGYIIAAQDGGQLTADIRRVIDFNDLSPPDEETRSKLRSESLLDMDRAVDSGLMTREEGRDFLEALADDMFPFKRSTAGELVSRDAPVGVFTGTLEILKEATLGNIPVDSGQALVTFLAPSSFTAERAAQIFDPIRAQRAAANLGAPTNVASTDSAAINASTLFNAGGQVAQGKMTPEFLSASLTHLDPENYPPDVAESLTSAALGGVPFPAPPVAAPLPGAPDPDTEDATANAAAAIAGEQEEIDAELTSLFSQLAVPADATTADKVAEAIGNGVTADQIKRLAKKGEFPIYPPEGFGTRPRFSIAEASRALRDRVRQHVAPTPTPSATEPASPAAAPAADFGPRSACIVVELPPALARFVPYKAKDPSPPHATLVYIADTQDREGGLLVCIRAVLGAWQPFDVRLPGRVDTFGSTDSVAGTVVAYAAVDSLELHALNLALVDAIKSAGFMPSEHPNGYTPHVTLAYLAPDETEYVGPCPQGEWEATSAAVYFGDDRHEVIPFGDALVQAADADVDDDERVAEAFKRYHETVNMGAAELREWAKSPWSNEASLSSGPIDRNLTLLETPREEWTLQHAASAMRTVSFVSRMKGAEQGEPVEIDGREGPSKRDISLRNWAFNPSK